jgi:hypothetical protein
MYVPEQLCVYACACTYLRKGAATVPAESSWDTHEEKSKETTKTPDDLMKALSPSRKAALLSPNITSSGRQWCSMALHLLLLVHSLILKGEGREVFPKPALQSSPLSTKYNT